MPQSGKKTSEKIEVDLIKAADAFNDRIIAFNPINVKIGGSINAALLLSQIYYWSKKMGHQEFYKTDVEWCEETCLSVKELRNAKLKLSERKLVKIERKGIPALTHYTLDREAYALAIKNLIENDETVDTIEVEQVVPKGHNCTCPKGITTIQEITQEIKKEKNKQKRKKDFEEEFEIFWEAYPNKKAKPKAKEAFIKAMDKIDPETIMEGLKVYAENTDPQFYNHPATWLNQEKWADEYHKTSKPEAKPLEASSKIRTGIDKTICDLIKAKCSTAFFLSWIEPNNFISESEGKIIMVTSSKLAYDTVDEAFWNILKNEGYDLIGWRNNV